MTRLLQGMRQDGARRWIFLDPPGASPRDTKNNSHQSKSRNAVVVRVGRQEAFVERGGGDHADRQNRTAQRAESAGGERGKKTKCDNQENRIRPDRHSENAIAKRITSVVAVDFSEPSKIPCKSGAPMQFAAVGSIVEIDIAGPPISIRLAKVLRMAVPDIAVEGNFEKRDGEDFGGLGVGAVEFLAEAHGDAVDQEGMEKNIPHAGDQDGREAAPGEDFAGRGAGTGWNDGLGWRGRRFGFFLRGGHRVRTAYLDFFPSKQKAKNPSAR